MYDYSYNYDYYYDSSLSEGMAIGLVAFAIIISVIAIAAAVMQIIGMWKMFKKAGKGGWEAIIPVYNYIVLIEISGLPMWYIALFFVPFANIYAMIMVNIEIAHRFGKSTGFGVLTTFFPFVCYPILGFGNARYSGMMAYTNANQQAMYGVPTYNQPIQPQMQPQQQPTTKNCPNCSAINSLDAQFCANCGNKI